MVNFYLDEGELPSIIQSARLKGNFKVLPNGAPLTAGPRVSTTAYKGKLYTFMNGLASYDPVTGKSENVSGNNPTALRDRSYVTLLAAPENGMIYLFGGRKTSSSATYFYDLWQYEVDTKTWTLLSTAAFNHASGAMGIHNGKLFITAGFGSGQAVTMHIFDLTTKQWSTGVAGKAERLGTRPMYVQHAGKLYIIGGVVTPNTLATVSVYDMAANTWSEKANLPNPLTASAVGCVGNYIYLFAGSDGTTDKADLLEYDIVANKWKLLATDTVSRKDTLFGVIAEKLYVVSGTPVASTANRNLEIS